MVRPFGKLLGRLFGSGAAGITAVSITLLRPQSFSACAEDDKTQKIASDVMPVNPRGSLGLAPTATWNDDWDCREGRDKSNVTRHLVLVRHGQYVEGGREDASMVLTELGRHQAELTGRRLAQYLPEGVEWKRIHQSDMIRAKETAEIIAAHLPKGVPLSKPNALLNEGYPADPVPMPRSMWKREDTWKDAPRIEAAFRALFYRATQSKAQSRRGDPGLVSGAASGSMVDAASVGVPSVSATAPATHEYELVVCHGNVIRYFICRALQMPPELWLRWAVFNCGITHICISPAGRCSIFAVGDVGHLDSVDALTYGHYHGYDMTRKSSRL